MSGDHDRVAFGGERGNHTGEFGLGRIVESAGGLIQQHDAWSRGELHREYEGELLAFGEITGMGTAVNPRHDAVEHDSTRPRGRGRLSVGRGAFVVDRLEIQKIAGGLRDEADELAGIGARKQLRIGTVDEYSAAVARTRTLQSPEKRRFARTIAAHDGDDFTAAQCEVDVTNGNLRSVADDDSGCGEDHLNGGRHRDCDS